MSGSNLFLMFAWLPFALPGAAMSEDLYLTRQPKISVFSFFITNVAKERGITIEEAADRLYDLGVRGFDAPVFDRVVDRLAATKIKPINFYYFAKFSGVDGGVEENRRALGIAVKYRVPRIMTIPPNFIEGEDIEVQFAQIVTNMKAFVTMAKTAGITVTVEDFGGRNNMCSYISYLKRILTEIPDLKYALDSGNLHYASRGESILEMLTFAQDRVEHVHLKDLSGVDCHKYETLGLGVVPNERIVRETWLRGYDGWYTLENPVGDTYVDTARQIAVLRAWVSWR